MDHNLYAKYGWEKKPLLIIKLDLNFGFYKYYLLCCIGLKIHKPAENIILQECNKYSLSNFAKINIFE